VKREIDAQGMGGILVLADGFEQIAELGVLHHPGHRYGHHSE
jgi:hypothetical protein